MEDVNTLLNPNNLEKFSISQNICVIHGRPGYGGIILMFLNLLFKLKQGQEVTFITDTNNFNNLFNKLFIFNNFHLVKLNSVKSPSVILNEILQISIISNSIIAFNLLILEQPNFKNMEISYVLDILKKNTNLKCFISYDSNESLIDEIDQLIEFNKETQKFDFYENNILKKSVPYEHVLSIRHMIEDNLNFERLLQ